MAKNADPFEVFCLYYLGLSSEGAYKFTNANQVAKHYNWSVGELNAYLKKHKMDSDTVVNTDFPLARHQVDLQLMAERSPGPIPLDFAERIFTEFQNRVGNRRDWLREIEEEREEDRTRKFNR